MLAVVSLQPKALGNTGKKSGGGSLSVIPEGARCSDPCL
jgi:hypothetical protein